MAERRMFAKTIIDSDAFLEMPQSTQLLYFHLMRGMMMGLSTSLSLLCAPSVAKMMIWAY